MSSNQPPGSELRFNLYGPGSMRLPALFTFTNNTMASLLTRPVKRESNTMSKAGRILIIEIRPGATDTVFIREKKRVKGYLIPLMKVYELGARLEADANIRERKQRQKDKKKLKDLR